MLCPSSVFPPVPGPLSPRPLSPLLELHWPVRSLWPEARPLFLLHLEQEMLRHLQEVRQSVRHVERLHQRIFQELERQSWGQDPDPGSGPRGGGAFAPISYQNLSPDGGAFALSLDTEQFSPEELQVRQVGRKLRVSGRAERKQDDGRGSSSYRCQEFRQELDLPAGVDPDSVSCSLRGGRLQIQAPRRSGGEERVVPIALLGPAPPAAIASEEGGAVEGGGAEQS